MFLPSGYTCIVTDGKCLLCSWLEWDCMLFVWEPQHCIVFTDLFWPPFLLKRRKGGPFPSHLFSLSWVGHKNKIKIPCASPLSSRKLERGGVMESSWPPQLAPFSANKQKLSSKLSQVIPKHKTVPGLYSPINFFNKSTFPSTFD